jgi:hypothetical protein
MIKKYLNKFLSIFHLKVGSGNGYIVIYVHPPTKKILDIENGTYKSKPALKDVKFDTKEDPHRLPKSSIAGSSKSSTIVQHNKYIRVKDNDQ